MLLPRDEILAGANLHIPLFCSDTNVKMLLLKQCQYSRGVEFKYIMISPYLSLLITLNDVFFFVRFFFFIMNQFFNIL